MASTSSSTTPALSPSVGRDIITPTAYITMFSLGSALLILLVTIACYGIFRSRHISDQEIGLASADQPAEKRGLDEGIIGGYPRMMFSQVKIEYGNSSGGDSLCCSICLADYKDLDMVLLLPNCGHFFHVKCVDQWLKLHPTCPMCRKSPVPVSVPPEGGLESQELRSE